MMIPLGTDRTLRRPTVVTWCLIVLTIGGFVVQLATGWLSPDSAAEPAAARFILHPLGGGSFRWWMLVSHQFLHANWWHLLGNMLFLWVFGPNIEDRFGRLGFPLFYLAAGAAAGGLHILLSPAGALGASGAIAGCTGAYLVMFPRTQIRVFSLLVVFGLLMVPAWWFIGLSIVWDLVSQSSGQSTGVAHLAHLGGYGFGAIISFALLATRILPREPYDVFSMARQAYRRQQIKSAAAGQQRAIEKHWERAKRSPTASRPTGANGHAKGTNGQAEPAENAGLAAARAEVARLLATNDLPAAAAAYKKMAEQYAIGASSAPSGSRPGAGPTTLSRRQQYDLANHFFVVGDHAAAVYAYERFLEAYPKDAESPQIRLLLGRVSARYMNDPVRAKALITEAMAGLRDEESREMARRELEGLG